MKIKIISLAVSSLLLSPLTVHAETFEKEYTITNELNKPVISLDEATTLNEYGADTSTEFNQLGDFYAYNERFRDTHKAFDAYETSAVLGNEYGRMMVGYMTLKGYGTGKNLFKGKSILNEIQEPYHLNAQYLIGKHELESGSTEEAISIFKNVKDQKSYQHLTNILIEQERFEEAFPYLQWLAGNKNDIVAKRELGKIYLIPEYANEELAIKFLTSASKDSDAKAQYELGHYYHKGTENTVANIKKAVHWYKMAAQNENSFATQELLKIWQDNLAHDNLYNLNNDPYLTKILQSKYAEEHYYKQ